MTKKFTPQTTITIQRTTALTCFTLVQETIEVARTEIDKLLAQGQTFPRFLQLPLDRLIEAQNALGLAIDPILLNSASSREADAELDNAWSALYEFLTGWTRLDPAICPDWEGVQALMALVFADGRAFLQLNYKSQWAESERRIETLKRSPYKESIEALGLSHVMTGIQASHIRYGEALGITLQPETSDAPALGASHLALRSQLREYIAKALAWAEPTDEESIVLSQALLAPIETWEAPTSASSKSKDESDGNAEAAEPAADSPNGDELEATVS